MPWSKKKSYKEFDNEKNSWCSKISHPLPITFLTARSLERSCTKGEDKKATGVGEGKKAGKKSCTPVWL